MAPFSPNVLAIFVYHSLQPNTSIQRSIYTLTLYPIPQVTTVPQRAPQLHLTLHSLPILSNSYVHPRPLHSLRMPPNTYVHPGYCIYRATL